MSICCNVQLSQSNLCRPLFEQISYIAQCQKEQMRATKKETN